MTYEVRPFETHHYLMLIDDLGSIGMDFEKLAANFANNGNYGRSGFCNNELLVCAGIMSPWPHTGVAWALLSSKAKHHVHFVHKAVKEGLWYFIHRFKLNRVEANVCDDLTKAKHWVERLGFEEESTMPKYGPHGETFKRYVILR